MAELTRREITAQRRGRGSRRPVRHGRLGKRRGWPTALRFVAGAASAILIATLSVGTFAGYTLTKKVQQNSVDISSDGELVPVAQVGAFKGGFNLLVVGVDNDEEQGDKYGARGGTLNDVNILLHVSDDHKSATVVSIPRDLVIPHPECEKLDVDGTDTGGTYAAMTARPLNEAMSRGGLACVVKTIENLTGLEIPYAATMSFRAVVKMTDAIGGVSVCLSDPIVDPKSDLDLTAGTQTISGKTALGFLRTRHGVGDGSDLARISVQQIYLSALVRQIKSADTLTNPGKLYALADAAATYVKLSTSLTSLDTMVAMAQTLRTINLSTMTFVQYPGTTGNKQYPGKVVPNVALATVLFDKIRADEPVKAGSLGRGSEEVGATDSPTGTPSPTPTENGDETDDLLGQSADQETCAKGFLK